MPAGHRRPFPWPLFGLLLAGCGVAEYEARMKDAQERMRRYDEESKLLGGGFQPPAGKSESGAATVIAPMFLRLPIGVGGTQTPKSPRDDLYYDYVPTAANTFAWVSVAVAKADDTTFEANLMKFFAPVTPVTRTTHVTRPPGRAGLAFERITYEDAMNAYSLNVHKTTQSQVAILYAVPKAQAKQAARAIDLSLDSFGFEGSLKAARDAYRPSSPIDFVPK